MEAKPAASNDINVITGIYIYAIFELYRDKPYYAGVDIDDSLIDWPLHIIIIVKS